VVISGKQGDAKAKKAKEAKGESRGAEPSPSMPPPLSGRAAELRAELLSLVASLDRGSAATAEDAAKVRKLVGGLVAEAAKEPRWRLNFPEDLDRLEGSWRLLYSSGFAEGRSSLGGLRAGPPLDSPVLEVGNIYQRYRISESRADTVVELRPPKWLRDTGLLDNVPFLRDSDPDTVLTLTQQFDVASRDSLRFAFVDGQVVNKVIQQLQTLRFPLAPLGISVDTSRDGPFTDTLITTYCDGRMRIGLGGRFGELRIFLRT